MMNRHHLPPPVINVVCECNKENKIKNKRDRIKTNMYFRIFDDLVRFPKDIWHYLKNSKKE